LEIGRDWGFDYKPRWARASAEEATAVLNAALDIGINLIDTAPAYQQSEERIGQWLEGVRRDEVVIATKAGETFDGTSTYDFSYRAILESIDNSLQRLGTDYLDIVQLHGPSLADLRSGEAEQALQDAKAAGKIRCTGLSADVEVALYGVANGSFDVVQVDYSLLDASAMKLLLPLARHQGVGVLVRSVFHRAALARPLGDELGVPAELLRQVEAAWAPIARHYQRDSDIDFALLRQVALQFALANPLVDCVLVGTRSAQHLRWSAEIAERAPLDEALLQELLAQAGGVDPLDRCSWVDNPLLVYYHDREWGRHPQGDARWFEFVVLETFQAGLSWRTILNKRKAFREAFQGFDVDKVAEFTESDIERLLNNPAIVRNRKKIEAAVENARIARELIREYGSLERFFLERVRTAADPLQILQNTFRFVGRTTAESIAYATGILPPPHPEPCWLSGAQSQRAPASPE
jgi:DNA-3-methyladenine glycosylase I